MYGLLSKNVSSQDQAEQENRLLHFFVVFQSLLTLNTFLPQNEGVYGSADGVHIKVQEGEKIKAGEPLMDGPRDPESRPKIIRLVQ